MVQLEASERDVSGDNEAEVSRLPGASQSGATHPGTSVPGASHDRASVEDLLRELRKERYMRIKAESALAPVLSVSCKMTLSALKGASK